MAIEKNSVVSIDYTLTDPQGNVVDSSKGKAPLVYLHGVGQIIPGLEKELLGKNVGDQLIVEVDPSEGYGHRDAKMVQAVPRANFKGVNEIKPGMQFQAQTPQGPRIVTVTNVTADEVTVDANHPLAGMPLKFEVQVVEVRPATAEEISHGHVHGAGGHQH